jgi:dipeptidyl aminopeptidase/acylaminoacyl peptidase
MSAETPTPATKANYPLAARWTAQKVGKMVFDTTVTPHWLDTGDRFWYTWESTKGRRFYLVDPARKTKTPVFDPAALAAALSTATGVPFDAQHLPMKTLKFVRNESAIQFEAAVPKDALIAGVKAEEQSTDAASDTPPPAGAAPTKNITVEYDLATGKLTVLPEAPPHKMRWASISPDGNTVVFARGQNLFLMDAGNYAKAQKKPDDASIVETQVTTDGEEHFGYARRLTDQEKGPLRRDQGKDKNPRVPSIAISWAKDSRKFAVIRRDQRKVGDLWVINSLANPRPTLETYRYDMPGEANATQSQLEIFDRSSNARVIAKAARFTDQALAIENTPATGRDKEHEKTEAQWVSADSSRIYFNRLSRDLHRLDICVADTATGEVKAIVEERMNVYIESKPIRMIDQDRAFLFWSERDGWGHYYLYDANGTLKNRVTQGEFVSEELLGVDEKTRTAYVVAEGKEEGENPYYPHLYRVGLDGSNMKLLDPGDATHAISMSDSTRYFVDNSSRVDSVPKSVLLDAQGAQMLDLETPDLTLLNAAGYRFPEPFHVKADDGVTDLYGVMYKPFDFDENKKYPIVAFVYPGPQTEQVTQVFSPKSPNVALAQLGFIVIEVGNRGGNPHRSKWYHTFGYGNLRDYGLADKKWAIEQLAALHPFIDADRVGIYGHSGGGFMSTAAMLIYPDFFKVAVSSSGNHENNIYNKWWSEKHHGVKETEDKDGKVQIEYSIDKNSEIARNLKGHLLLATGDMDDNVHPANTLRMVDALIKANKRFDMIVLPGKRHPYADESEYFFWVRADYFARHLLGSFDQSVDMWEINNEKQMKPNVPPATRRRATGTTSGPTIE